MSANAPACIFRVLEGNIQEFVLTEVSRRAIDEMFDITEKNLSEAVSKGGLTGTARPVLIDSRVGLQPINYSLLRLRSVMKKFPGSSKELIALILPTSPLLKTLSMMMRPIAPMRIYTAQERDQALAWLRASREAKH